MERFNRSFFADAWHLAAPYWRSEERHSAYRLLAAVVALNLGIVYINVLITEWYNGFYDAMQHYDAPAFWAAMLRFCWLAASFIGAAVYQTYLGEMLYIRWRRWLTNRYVHEWLSERTYYRMQLFNDNTDNPDQRIADDIGAYVSGVRHLSLGLLRSVVTIGSFVTMLWMLSYKTPIPFHGKPLDIPGYLVWAALIYSVAGTWLSVRIGRPLIGLNFNQQRYDADFRFGLVRVRENSESIALYGGEPREREGLGTRFASVFSNYWSIMRRQKMLNWFSNGYVQVAVIFPFLVAAPAYFSHAIEIGLVIQIASAFGQVQGAMSYVVSSFDMLAAWHAVVDRLSRFHKHMTQVQDTASAPDAPVCNEGPSLSLSGLTLHLPDGKELVRDMSLAVGPGTSVLVTGPSGSGKSTLMRTLAGIWPFGTGQMAVPARSQSLFLPQKPYIPLGSLREILLYPHGLPDTKDTELATALRTVGLERLADLINETRPWSLTLSLGEQQRLAFARILVQKPAWIYLDEATSALDEAAEADLYRMLRRELPGTTFISVGHRSTLNAFHERRLELRDGRIHELEVPGGTLA